MITMILSLFFGLMAIVMLACAFYWMVIISGIAIFIITLYAGLKKYIEGSAEEKRLRNAEPSIMMCPNCGSTHIYISRMRTGAISASSMSGSAYRFGYSGLVGGGTAVSDSIVTSQRMARCQDCGFDYPYVTQADINAAINRAVKEKNSGAVWLAVSVVSFAVIIAVII